MRKEYHFQLGMSNRRYLKQTHLLISTRFTLLSLQFLKMPVQHFLCFRFREQPFLHILLSEYQRHTAVYPGHAPLRLAGKDSESVTLRVFMIDSRQIQNFFRRKKLILLLFLCTGILPLVKLTCRNQTAARLKIIAESAPYGNFEAVLL